MAEDLHASAAAPSPALLGVAPSPYAGLRYEQDAHGRYLVGPGGVVALIVGADGLEAQRLGRELAAGPEALDAIAAAIAGLDEVELEPIAYERAALIAGLRCDLVSVLTWSGRLDERYHPAPAAPPTRRVDG